MYFMGRNTVFALRRFGSAGESEGSDANRSREIRRLSVESIFQTHIDRLAKLISELFHLFLNPPLSLTYR